MRIKKEERVMKWWKIRFNASDLETVTKFLNGYKEPFNAFIFVLHTHTQYGARAHIHGVYQTILGKDTIRNKIQSLTGLEGSEYCIQALKNDTEFDLKKAIQYLFHTKHGNVTRVLLHEGISPELVRECQEAAREVSEDFDAKKKKKKSDAKQEQITGKKIMLEVIEECRPDPQKAMPSPDIIMKVLIEKFMKHQMRLPTTSSMDTTIMTIYANWGFTQFVMKCYRSNVLHAYEYANGTWFGDRTEQEKYSLGYMYNHAN